jgi:hypothetical protein
MTYVNWLIMRGSEGDMERSTYDICCAFTPASLSAALSLIRSDVGISLCGSFE